MKEKLLKEKENIQNKQKNQNKRLKAIEAKLKQLEEESRRNWKPRSGDEYYFINDGGSIFSSIYSDWCTVDLGRIALGNCFKTASIAGFERERLRILAKLKKYAYKFSQDEWEISIKKFYIECDRQTHRLQISHTYVFTSHIIYFKTFEDAQNAIANIGADKIRKYYFRIGESDE